MLYFQRWLEQDEDGDYPVLSPKNVARRWLGKMPAPGSQNEKAIWQFVTAMSNDDINIDLVAVVKRRREVKVEFYDELIEGNLLYSKTGKLRRATGMVAWPEEAHFGFYLYGVKAGNLEIKFPPVVFAQYDRELLASIIWHELRHAEDWAKGDVHYAETPSKFHMGKYARHILEARAYADQLQYLLSRVRDVHEVMDMLSSDSEFALDEGLHETALQFLSMLGGNTNESFGSWVAPLVTAASTLIPQQQGVPPQPPAIVRQTENQEAKEAARIVGKFIKLMLFRNFVANSTPR